MIAMIFFLNIIVIGSLLVSAIIFDDGKVALLIGMILSGIGLILVISLVFPIVFKDYIEYYWKKQKEKEEMNHA